MMNVIRPVRHSDLDALYQLAQEAGHGLTTLPADKGRLEEKIVASNAAFSKAVEEPFDEYYLFVLEDASGQVIGTSALEAAVGMKQPFYTYKVGIVVHSSPDLGVHNPVQTLFLGNDYTGATELCTLFLSPRHRKGHNGKLLSKARFLFLAQFPERFSNLVIAEMRGFSDEHGHSPFWDAIGRHFFSMSFAEADRLSGLGSNQFIAELMPKYPIYTAMLPEAAQRAIGRVHPQTEPALRLLKSDGFRYRNYVDIFDAGPTIECESDKINTVRDARVAPVQRVVDRLSDSDRVCLIGNCEREAFRATIGPVAGDPEDGWILDAAVADRLNLVPGDPVRVSPLNPNATYRYPSKES
jgi:arginine N-succinyltransferase